MNIDCFTFLNEFDILEIRFEELFDVIDWFVIVEATRTFKGDPKPLHFLDNAHRFARWASKVRHIIVDDLPDGDDPWCREHFQRECFKRGADQLGPEDLVIVSDVDEIPSRQVFQLYAKRSDFPDILSLDLRAYYYYFNYRRHLNWHYAKLVRGSYFNATSIQDIRYHALEHDAIAPDAGWHFTYMGGLNQIYYKVRNFSHWNDATTEPMLRRFDRDWPEPFRHEKVSAVDIDQTFPRYIRENQKMWEDRGFIYRRKT